MKTCVFSLLFVCLGLSLPASAAAQQRSAAERTARIHVTAVDSKGAPVTDLMVKDLAIREDGVAREVLSVAPATDAAEVMLLIDDSQAASPSIAHLRDALAKFVTRLQGKAKIGIVTIGERPTSVVEYTDDTARLQKGVTRIFARPGSGAYLLDGIREAARGMQKRETDARRVIIALTTEGVEFSNLQYERVLEDLHAAGATLHALAIGTPAASTTDEMRNRNLVLSQGTEQTGGRRDQLLSPMAIADRLDQIAGEILNTYVVTYGRPDTLIPPETIKVASTREGVTVRARTKTLPK